MYDIAICDDSAQDRSTLKDDIMKCEIYSEHIRFHEYCSGKELLSAIGIAHFSIYLSGHSNEGSGWTKDS